MKKQMTLGCIVLFLCAAFLVACGSSSFEGKDPVKNTAEVASVSKSQESEKQPYEIFRSEEENEEWSALDEDEQAKKLKDSLSQFEFLYQETDEIEGISDYLAGVIKRCDEMSEDGKSCIAPILYIYGASFDPIMCIGFSYVSDDYLDFDTVQIDTEKFRYTYDSTLFIQGVQQTTVEVSDGQEELRNELALCRVTDDELDMLADDIMQSETVSLTFGRYNTAKPVFVECEMPEEDKQSIADALNAYYLYVNANERVRAKALSEISTTEVQPD